MVCFVILAWSFILHSLYLACNNLCLDGKFCACLAERFCCNIFGNSIDFKNNPAGSYFGLISLGVALSFTHAHFRRFLGEWTIVEDANPYLSCFIKRSTDRLAASLKLFRLYAAGF